MPKPAARFGPWGPLAAMLSVAILWGSLPPVTGRMLVHMDPFLLSASRYSLAVPVLALLARLVDGAWPGFHRLDLKPALILGAGGMATCAVLYAASIYFTDPVTAAAVVASSPLLTALLVWGLDGVSADRRTWIGIFCGVAGALIVALTKPGAAQWGSRPPGGELLMAAGLTAWAWYSSRAPRWLGARHSVLGYTTLTTAAASLTLWLGYGAARALGLARPLPADLGAGLLDLAYLAVFPTALAIYLWNVAVARLGVTQATLLSNLTPVFAALISALLGFALTGGQILGGLIIIGAVVFVQVGAWRRAANA